MAILLAQGDSEVLIMPSAKRSRTSWFARSAFRGTFHMYIRDEVQPLAFLPPGAWQFYTLQCQLYIS